MTARRLPDWPERLAACIETRRHRPFAWGTNDCVTFVADGLLAMTGRDPLGELRGAWADEAGAQRELERLGGMVKAVSAHLGEPRRVATAHRGAPVLARMPTPAGEVAVLGLVVGDSWCAPGPEGLAFRPLAEAVLAWEA